MIPLLQKRWPPAAEVRIDGESVAVAVKVSTRARSYRLSLPHGGAPLLTVPKFGRWGEAKAFLDRHTPWLADRLERSVKPVAFVRGAIVPLRGVNHRIVPTGRVRGVVEVGEHDGELALLVPGAPEHRARRLIDWLKVEAQKDLEKRVAHPRRDARRHGQVDHHALAGDALGLVLDDRQAQFQLAADPRAALRARLCGGA